MVTDEQVKYWKKTVCVDMKNTPTMLCNTKNCTKQDIIKCMDTMMHT